METKNYISDSIKGIERNDNKDRIFTTKWGESLLSVLFDGISSAPEANKGIDLAVDYIEKNYIKLSSLNIYNLSDMMFESNLIIAESNLDSPFTTYSAIYISGKENLAVISNLGDSRIYEISPQYIKQLSEDDSLMHNKNVVTKYLGMLELEREDFSDLQVDIKDKKMLLCSDGFYTILEKNLSRFHSILNFKNSLNIKKSLSAEIKNKNLDDSSYILIY
ncbi:MAG TPA: protein phosphatase 2C domain-containing protein [Candidatus Paceibacterota bacterium]